MIDPGKSLSYNITIQCALDGFCFVVHDLEENKIIDIELYQTSGTGDEAMIMETLEKAVYKKGLYERPVRSVRFIVGNRLSTLVPEELFDEGRMDSYFRFCHELPQGYSLGYDTLPLLGCINVFAISDIQEQRARKLWDNVIFTHQSSIFLNAVMREDPYDDKTIAYVNVNSRSFDLAIVSEGRLSFFNNFKFNTQADFAYFLMYTFEQQGLSGKEVPVCFSGLIAGNAEIIKLCERYIKRISFIKPDGSINVDIALSDTPFQYYYIPYKSLS
ncbi:MAG: DUF3822 family protein [Bacteroidales bacterium]|nr:DUF3822 family protein [Bacteroidales bacterium]